MKQSVQILWSFFKAKRTSVTARDFFQEIQIKSTCDTLQVNAFYCSLEVKKKTKQKKNNNNRKTGAHYRTSEAGFNVVLTEL